MKNIILLAALLYSCVDTNAQLRIEQLPLSPIKVNTGFYVYGANNLAHEIPYSKINGSPFWNDDFITATLFVDDNAYGPCPVKLNLANKELHFLNNNGEEFTAQQGLVDKIIFHSQDNPHTILAIFYNDEELTQLHPKFNGLYVQQLNDGHTKLLKISRKTLSTTDSLFGTRKKYSFEEEETFFIRQKGKIQPLKKLNRKEILPILYLDKDLEKWAETQKISYTKEEDVVALMKKINQKRN